MKFAVLFSGGKDSTYALMKAMSKGSVKCLVTMVSENPESYMFHTPNIHVTELQAKVVGLPLIKKTTPGRKEEELKELKQALHQAKQEFGVEAVATGAIRSEYQSSRIQEICDQLGLKTYNPLWGRNELEFMEEIISKGFEVMITGVAAYPLTSEWLGRIIDQETLRELKKLSEDHGLNPAGEGGEFETTVLNTPFFRKKVVVKDYDINYENYSGTLTIREAVLE